MNWFRFYNEVLDDPKVQMLEPELFKAWVNLLCLAAKNNGKLPDAQSISFALRCDETMAKRYIERLRNATLIDRLNGGADGWHYAPHGWGKRQYKSDSSSERVKRYRQRSKPVTVTPPETETDTDITLPKGKDASVASDARFWADAKSYLGAGKGSLIGKWCRDYGKAETAKAITAAQIERAVDPVPYIERILRGAKRGELEYPIC